LDGLRIGGFITPDVRMSGRRVAFRVVDLYSGKEAVLASIKLKTGPRVGQYRVDVSAFERVALPALDYAEKECDLVCVDEIGRMELFSQSFRHKIEELFKSENSLLAVVHRDYMRIYADRGTILTVTPDNRDALVAEISNMIRKTWERTSQRRPRRPQQV